ncbi:putative membrane protein [Gluconacetobacter diazotrophicus PA1 5]|uniref:Putative membrane protein n=1 Tax=Gluconacetobacter diazotrophicus (strain ATCC 49037 / DSM 5601 / CCUG 37298 / CIP 103539 / LMG 7603 / PAl5) TaxID=272568 RepID=A9HIJ7_GLUDA|nr:putative membrane protein [Gluconacetobacter diazotrophicus PA1 5]
MSALLDRLPPRMRAAIEWLRVPSRRPVRLVAGGLLCMGGFLFFLPVLGLWMLPLGLLLLSEDVPLLRRFMDRILIHIARKHPDWLEPKDEK